LFLKLIPQTLETFSTKTLSIRILRQKDVFLNSITLLADIGVFVTHTPRSKHASGAYLAFVPIDFGVCAYGVPASAATLQL